MAVPIEGFSVVAQKQSIQHLLSEGSIGLGRGYIEGWWTSDDPTADDTVGERIATLIPTKGDSAVVARAATRPEAGTTLPLRRSITT